MDQEDGGIRDTTTLHIQINGAVIHLTGGPSECTITLPYKPRTEALENAMQRFVETVGNSFNLNMREIDAVNAQVEEMVTKLELVNYVKENLKVVQVTK